MREVNRSRLRLVLVVAVIALGVSSLAEAKQDPPPLLTVEVVAPSQTQECFLLVPSPGLVDRNPGSLTRALVEAIARETGLVYAQLQRVYESSFVSTGTGGAETVALVVSALEPSDQMPVLAQADVKIGPSEGSKRPVVSVELRQQYVSPNVSVCTEAVLAGSKQKSKDSDENGDG